MEIADKSDCRIIWYLFAGLNLVFCSFYMTREICVFSRNMIRENVNQNREIRITSR